MYICAALMFASIAALFFRIPSIIASEAEKTRTALVGQITDSRSQIIANLNAWEMDAGKQISTAIAVADRRSGEALTQTARAEADLNTQLSVANASIASNLSVANENIASVLLPVQQSAAQINAALPDFLDCQTSAEGVGNRNCLYLRYSDIASEVDQTLGQATLASRAIVQAVPDSVKEWREISQHVNAASDQAAKASEQTALTMKHLQEASKPLPKWLRIGLAVAPPIAETGAAAAAAGAALGIFK